MYMNISNLVCWDISVKKRYYIVKILFFVTPRKDENTCRTIWLPRTCEKLTMILYCLFINYIKKEKGELFFCALFSIAHKINSMVIVR
jgi:hypothetical protein